MKKILNKKGMGLLETVVAIAILGAIILPLLNVFVQSAKADEKARGVLNANYISQNYIEKLSTQTYETALQNAPNRQEINGYYLTAVIQPYGSVSGTAGNQRAFSNIIIYEDGSMLAVMPDGKWTVFGSVPSEVTYGTFGSRYTFSVGALSMSGDMEYPNCVVSVNAMRQSGDVSLNINTTASYKTILYSKSFYTDNYSFTNTFEIIEDLLLQDSSLVHVTTYLYEDSLSNEEVSSFESYTALKNWE